MGEQDLVERLTPGEGVNLGNPFPGLRPFRVNESDRFFGQRDRIEDLVYRLSRQRFVAMLGLSGCGKSSLINAGLLAQLRSTQLPEEPPRWLIARLAPGDNPLRNLASALHESVWQASDVAKELALDTRALPRLAEGANRTPQQKILLVVDQFEDLFRYQNAGDPQRKNQAAYFVQLLLEAVRQENCPIHVLLTMRSEFLGDCATFHGLAEQVNAATYLIPKMDRESIEEAIVSPVEWRGATIDPSLVQHLINESEALEDGLPLLQHALRWLWDQWVERGEPASPLGWADFGERSLGAQLNRHLDSTYGELTASQQKTAERLFRALSDRDARGRVTRRPLEYASIAMPDLDVVIKTFQNEEQGRTFLVRSGETLDISHECLLRRWDKAQQWLEKENRDHENLLQLVKWAKEAGWPRRMAALEGFTLQSFVKWRADSSPDAVWAKRYGLDFDDAQAYLDWSLAEAESKTRRQRFLVGGIVAGTLTLTLLVCAGILVFWSTLVTPARAPLVIVNPPVVTLDPLKNETFAFVATVLGDRRSAVTWSATEGRQIDRNGVYRHTGNRAAGEETFTVRATSVKDPSRSDTAVVHLVPNQHREVLPQITSTSPGQQVQFRLSGGGPVVWKLSQNDLGNVADDGTLTISPRITRLEPLYISAWSGSPSRVVAATATVVNPPLADDNIEDWRLLAFVTVMGALGSLLYCSQSLISHIGSGTFDVRWFWVYISRSFVGAGLALVIFFVVGAGTITGTTTSDMIKVGMISSLSGLFSDQLLKKLSGILRLFEEQPE